MTFWQKFGPNHFEAIALGILGGVGLVQRVGPGYVAAAAGLVAVGSYIIRHFVKS